MRPFVRRRVGRGGGSARVAHFETRYAGWSYGAFLVGIRYESAWQDTELRSEDMGSDDTRRSVGSGVLLL